MFKISRFYKIICVLFSIIIVTQLSSLPDKSVSANVTKAEVGVLGTHWMRGYGVDVYLNGGNYGTTFQCVELAARVYKQRGWTTIYSPNGKANGIPLLSSSMFVDYKNRPGYIPRGGDLIIHGGTANHVAVVDYYNPTNGTIEAKEQNAPQAYGGVVRYNYNLSTGTLSGGNGGGTITALMHQMNNDIPHVNFGPTVKSTMGILGVNGVNYGTNYYMQYGNAKGLSEFANFSSSTNGVFNPPVGTASLINEYSVDTQNRPMSQLVNLNTDKYTDVVQTRTGPNGLIEFIAYVGESNGLIDQEIKTNSSNYGYVRDSEGRGQGLFGDVNGDGISDYVMPFYNDVDGGLNLISFVGDGRGHFNSEYISRTSQIGLTGIATDNVGRGLGMLADVNGDGKSDYVMPYNDATGKLVLATYLSLGNGYFSRGLGSGGPAWPTGFVTDSLGRSQGKFGDVNGDGRSDFIMTCASATGTLELYVYLGEASGHFSYPRGTGAHNFNYAKDVNGLGQGLFGDINGDGKTDYIMPHDAGNGIIGFVTFKSNGYGYFEEGVYSSAIGSTNYGFVRDKLDRGQGSIADVNKDGISDYVMPHLSSNGYIGFVTFFGNKDGTLSPGVGSALSNLGFVCDKNGHGVGVIA